MDETKASMYIVAMVGVVAAVGILVLILNSAPETFSGLSNDYSISETDLTGQVTKTKVTRLEKREKLADDGQSVDDGSNTGSSSSTTCVENEGEMCSQVDCGLTNSANHLRGWQACTISCTGGCVCPTC